MSDILLTKFLTLPLTTPDEHLDLSDAFATTKPMDLDLELETWAETSHALYFNCKSSQLNS